MPLSKQHKAQTRARIVSSAGAIFRDRGFARAGIDDLMAGAGLTRGGFYAHFDSKEAVFVEVVASDHGLIRQLRRRLFATSAGARRETLQLMRDYLDPAHQQVVSQGCSFAALTGDVARSSEAAKAGYRAAFQELAAEFLRQPGQDADSAWHDSGEAARARAVGAAQAALGATVLAAALAPSDAADSVLRSGRAQFESEIRALWALQLRARRRLRMRRATGAPS